VLALVDFGNWNPAFLSDDSHRLRKAAPFDPHHKIEDAAASAAPETLEQTLAGVNVERWCLFRVEWTTSQVVGAAFLEAHIVRDNADYVPLILYIVSKAARQTHSLIQSEMPISRRSSSMQL